ncbi:PR-1 class pathogen-related protein, partial [Fusarium tjaetaba]
MHFSSFIVSMMTAGAMAAPWGNGNKHYNEVVVTEYEYVTHYVTAGGNAPQATYVPEQPAAPVQESQPAPV